MSRSRFVYFEGSNVCGVCLLAVRNCEVVISITLVNTFVFSVMVLLWK